MLTIFWNSCGIVHMDFVDRHQRLNAEYYCEQLRKARQSVRKPRNQNLHLLHDNAPIHTAATTTTAIEDSDFHVLPHPHSSDLAPSDYFLFRYLKHHLRGERFVNSEDVKDAVMEFFNSRSRDFFHEAFRELPKRWSKCVENEGITLRRNDLYLLLKLTFCGLAVVLLWHIFRGKLRKCMKKIN